MSVGRERRFSEEGGGGGEGRGRGEEGGGILIKRGVSEPTKSYNSIIKTNTFPNIASVYLKYTPIGHGLYTMLNIDEMYIQ